MARAGAHESARGRRGWRGAAEAGRPGGAVSPGVGRVPEDGLWGVLGHTSLPADGAGGAGGAARLSRAVSPGVGRVLEDGLWRVLGHTSLPAGGAAVQEPGSTSRMRSSAAAGSPRPSRLDVVTHSMPSGATTTVRIRP